MFFDRIQQGFEAIGENRTTNFLVGAGGIAISGASAAIGAYAEQPAFGPGILVGGIITLMCVANDPRGRE
jgi:hypothetical protein